MRMAPELFGKPAGGPPLWMRFLGCNPRHHSLALAPFPAPAGIVHLMIEVAALDDQSAAMDRCTRRGATMSATLGRHANDLMVSFSVATPGGFDVEYGTNRPARRRRNVVGRRRTAVGGLWDTDSLRARIDRGAGGNAGRVRAGTAGRVPQVLGHFCTGVTVITALVGDKGEPVGFACQSDAPAAARCGRRLVLFCPSRGSATWPRIEPGRPLLDNV